MVQKSFLIVQVYLRAWLDYNGESRILGIVLTMNNNEESRLVMSDSLLPHGRQNPWNYPDQKTGVGSLSLLQRIFQTQGWYPGLLHYRQILYQLSHKETQEYWSG